MENSQRTTFLLMLLVGAVWFAAMIPPNLTGAKTPEMLAVFEVDEFAQYPHVIRMLTPGDTLYGTLRNFFIYQHYFYGFPFYFVSAVSLLPLKWLVPNWTANTTLIVAWLRQTVSVLPMLAANILLVWIFTEFRNRRLSLGLLVFLLAVPAVVLNNFWWHPDSLSFLFIALVFFFLHQDKLRFGRHFYFAAAACGIATGTKYQGLYFALAIPFLSGWGVFRQKLTIRKALKSGILFVPVMMLFVIISNPLLLLPQERAEIISVQKLQFEQTSQGTFTLNQNRMINGWSFSRDIETNFAGTWFFLLAAGGCLVGFSGGWEAKAQSLALTAYLLLCGAVLFTAQTTRTHYLIPFALPLFAAYAQYFAQPARPAKITKMSWVCGALAVFPLMVLGLNIWTDAGVYRAQLEREQNSGSLRFYQAIEQRISPDRSGSNSPVKVLKDWKVYFPAESGIEVAIDWDMITPGTVEREKPDVILLERENIRLFRDQNILSSAVNPERMAEIHRFYGMAAEDTLPGYRRVFRDHFGEMFVRVDDSGSD